MIPSITESSPPGCGYITMSHNRGFSIDQGDVVIIDQGDVVIIDQGGVVVLVPAESQSACYKSQ